MIFIGGCSLLIVESLVLYIKCDVMDNNNLVEKKSG